MLSRSATPAGLVALLAVGTFGCHPAPPPRLSPPGLSATSAVGSARPPDAVGCLAIIPPEGVVIAPGRLEPDEKQAGLRVFTFDQATPHCGPIARRYLSYRPHRAGDSPARAAVILLHGLGASAENFRSFQTHAAFERLADEHGFAVIYANGAPSSASHPKLANSGSWRAHPDPGTEIDDFVYLDTVVAEMKGRGDLAKDGDVFLVGQSNGGGMVLEAARQRPGVYAGVAAFMPFAGWRPPAPAAHENLPPLLLAYSDDDPGLPRGYAASLRTFLDGWLHALGADESALVSSETALPDRIDEGADYSGGATVLLATRKSHVSRGEVWSTKSGPRQVAAEVLHFDHAGHFWPYAVQDTAPWALSRWGFRNQDIDGADACWAFFARVLAQRHSGHKP